MHKFQELLPATLAELFYSAYSLLLYIPLSCTRSSIMYHLYTAPAKIAANGQFIEYSTASRWYNSPQYCDEKFECPWLR